MNPQIVVTESDARRLRLLVGTDGLRRGPDAASLEWLERELDRARVVSDSEVPEDVITLNSEVELEDLEDGEVDTYTVVLPSEADANRKRVSVLAPLGMGMLGFREGDHFEWPVPSGTARYRVRRLLKRTTASGQTDGPSR